MKRLQSQILSILIVLAGIITAPAQEVMVTVQPVMNPLPPQVMPFVDDPGRFFSITMTNPTDEAIPIYLGLQVEQILPQDFALNTPVDRQPSKPFVLRPQSTVTLSRSDLRILFREMNVNEIALTGGVLSDFTGGVIGLMPEGKFKGYVTAYKWDPASTNPQAVSNPNVGICYFDICYKAPAPQITYPYEGLQQAMGEGNYAFEDKYVSEFGEYAVVDFKQPVLFQWLPSRTACGGIGNSSVKYKLEIYHMTPGIAVSDAADFCPLVFTVDNLKTPQYQYFQSQAFTQMKFVEGEYYAMRVIASTVNKDSSKPEYIYIENDGVSPYRLFRVKSPEQKKPEEKKPEAKKDSIRYFTVPELKRVKGPADVYAHAAEEGVDMNFKWENPKTIVPDTTKTEGDSIWVIDPKIEFEYTARLYHVPAGVNSIDSLKKTKSLYYKKQGTRELTLAWSSDLKKNLKIGEEYCLLVEAFDKNCEDSIIFTGHPQNVFRFVYPADYSMPGDCNPGYKVENQKFKEFSEEELKSGKINLKIGEFSLHVLRMSVNENYKGTPAKEEKTVYHQGKPDHSQDAAKKGGENAAGAGKDTDPGKDARPSFKDEPAAKTEAGKADGKTDGKADAKADGKADGKKKTDAEEEEEKKVVAYMGEGYVTWRPYGKDIKIAVVFDSLVINTDNEVIKGMATSKRLPVDFIPYDMMNSLMDKWGITKAVGKKFSQEELKGEMEYLKKSEDFSEYYNYCRDGMGYANTVYQLIDGGVDADLGAQGITLPLALPTASVPSLPLDISLVNLRVSPTTSSIDLIALFKMPDSDYTDTEVLAFAAPGLCISPESPWAASGQCGLLYDMSLKDPDTGYECKFKAPTNFTNINDGTFVSWDDGKFDFITIDMEMMVPGLIPDNGYGKRVPGQEGAAIGIKAKIADWDDWTANVTMSPFQVEEAPGFVFDPTGTTAGILYDHSKSFNVDGMAFPAMYDWTKWTGAKTGEEKGKVTPAEMNAWQGFYLERMRVIFPTLLELDMADDSGPVEIAETEEEAKAALKAEEEAANKLPNPAEALSVSVSGLMIDRTGVSVKGSLNNLVDIKGRISSFRLKVQELYLTILQNNFNNTGIRGEITVPILGETMSFDSKVEYVSKGEEKKVHYVFNCKPKNDLNFDFILASVSIDNSGTYFNVDKYDGEDAKIEFVTSGVANIGSKKDPNQSIDFSLPGLRFAGMRVANFAYDTKDKNRFAATYSNAIKGVKTGIANARTGAANNGDKAPEMKDEYADIKSVDDFQKKLDKNMSENYLKSETADVYFGIGDWSFASPEKKFWNIPLTLKNIEIKVKNDSVFGLLIDGGVKMLGNEKCGIGATAGFIIWSDVNWDDFEADYLETTFDNVALDGSFGGVVKIKGELKKFDDKTEKGWSGSLNIDVAELFKLEAAGKYATVTKTEADLKIDNEENPDSTYKAGYFYGAVDGIPSFGAISLKSIQGGFYFNMGLNGAGYDNPDKLKEALKKPVNKYGSYGGAFGLGISVMSNEKFLNGDMSMIAMIDMNGGGRLSDLHLQGNIHALCTDSKAEKGIVNARADIIYTNRKFEDKPEDNVKKLKICVTLDAEATMADAYKYFTGQELKVPDRISDLAGFDAQNAEDKGDNSNGNDHSKTSSDGSRTKSKAENQAESNGFLKGGCSAHMGIEFEVRTYPNRAENKHKWHLYIGEPEESKRCRITFIDFAIGKNKPIGVWAKLYANAYLCLGNELPFEGGLPDVPADVMEALGMKDPAGKETQNQTKLQKVREETITKGPGGPNNGGIMIGAAVGAEFGCNALFCYCDVAGKLGFDMVLKFFTDDCVCGDGQKMGGADGFYAMGQLYSMLKGELGLMIDLWIYKGKVPLVDMTLGALLKGGFPNPAWAYGRLRAKGSILGGLIKFNSTIEMKVGRVCIPPYGNPLDDIKIFGSVSPGEEKREDGWKDDNLASCYSYPTFTTNMRMGSRLNLIDEGARAKKAGMNGDETKYTTGANRTYIFRLDPQFEFAEFKSGETDESGLVSKTMVDYQTMDYENFTVNTGALEAHKFYRLKLGGYCKEIVNGKEVDPVFKDKESDFKEEHREWRQECVQYFRTGGYSKNIIDDVMGYQPSFNGLMDEICNPYIMMWHDRTDYWTDHNYEFYMDIKKTSKFEEYDPETGGKTTKYRNVYPDIEYTQEGYRLPGQKSKYEKLPVIQKIEEGVDSLGVPYKYVYAGLEYPAPDMGNYLVSGEDVVFEIYRFNQSDYTQFLSKVEQQFSSIMKVTAEDVQKVKDEVTKLGKDSKETVMKEMCDYYLQMEELYGPNEAKQRLLKYKEGVQNNNTAFYELIFESDPSHYYGKKNFRTALRDGTRFSAGYGGSRLPNGQKWPEGCQYRINSIKFKDRSTKSNDPYYCMNYWMSHAGIWRANVPKYKLCKQSVDHPYTLTYDAYYEEFRSHNVNNSGPLTDQQFVESYRPDYSRNNPLRTWHGTEVYHSTIDINAPIEMVEKIIRKDSEAATEFETSLNYRWSWLTLGSSGSEMMSLSTNSKEFDYFKKRNNEALEEADEIRHEEWAGCGGGMMYSVSMPTWQIGLMYAAEDSRMGLTYSNLGHGPLNSHRYMSKEWSGFNKNAVLPRISEISYTFKKNSGYNIKNNQYGIIPTQQGQSMVTVVQKRSASGSGWNPEVDMKDYIHIPDPEFRKYILTNYDRDRNGKLDQYEAENIRTVRCVGLKIKSFSGLEMMPFVETFFSEGNRLKNTDVINFNLNTVMKEIEIYGSAPLVKVDRLKFLKKLVIYNPDVLKSYTYTLDKDRREITFGYHPDLTYLTLAGTMYGKIMGLENLTGLRELDLRGNIQITEPYDLTKFSRLIKADMGSQVNSHGQSVHGTLDGYAFVSIIDGGSLEQYMRESGAVDYDPLWYKKEAVNAYHPSGENPKKNFNVFIKPSERNSSDLDPKLEQFLLSKYGKKMNRMVGSHGAGASNPFNQGGSVPYRTQIIIDYEQTKKVETLDLSGLGIDSLTNLDKWCPYLRVLNVNNNNLKNLDLSVFPRIYDVRCDDNGLYEIIFPVNCIIGELSCNNNALVKLD